MRFPNAAKGVKKIFTAEILSLIAVLIGGTVMVLATVLGISASENNETAAGVIIIALFVCAIAALVMLIVGGIMNIVGYIQAAIDEAGFARAIVCTIFSVIFYVLGTLFQGTEGVLSWLCAISLIASQLLRMLVTIFAIGGLINLSDRCDRPDMVNKGQNIVRVLCAIYVLNCVAILSKELFGDILSNDIFISVLTIVAAVLMVVEFVLYLSYLSKAAKMLREH